VSPALFASKPAAFFSDLFTFLSALELIHVARF
jgi:hypothetical protein